MPLLNVPSASGNEPAAVGPAAPWGAATSTEPEVVAHFPPALPPIWHPVQLKAAGGGSGRAFIGISAACAAIAANGAKTAGRNNVRINNTSSCAPPHHAHYQNRPGSEMFQSIEARMGAKRK